MANDLPDIGARIALDLQQYNTNITKAIRDASSFDRALDDLITSANRTDKAINSIDGDVEFKVTVNEGDIDGITRKIEGLDTSISTKVSIDDSQVTSINTILNRLDSQTITPKIDVDQGTAVGDIKAVQGPFDHLDTDTATPKVDAETTEAKGELLDIKGQLEQLRTLAVIDLVMNVKDMAATVPVVGAMFELDRATRQLAATTNNEIPQAADVINSVYNTALVESRDEASAAIAQTYALSGSIESLRGDTESLLTVAKISGNDFNAVLRTADTLVKSGLVPNLQSAADVMTTGFQSGLDKGGAFLDTLNEFGPQAAQAGFSVEGFMSTLLTASDAGAFNLEKVGEAVQEIQLKAAAAVSDPEGVEALTFDKIGVLDETQAFVSGELAGEEFVAGVIAAAKKGLEEGDLTATDITALFGAPAEALTMPVLLSIDPIAAQAELDTAMAGSTAKVADVAFGDIGTQLTVAFRSVESELASALGEILAPTIQDVSTRISTFTAEIEAGKGLADAINVALGLEPGTFQRIESTLANMLIGILEVVANIQEFFGGEEADTGLRTEIARLQAGQLEFDLTAAANLDEFESAVGTAIRRGVGADTISEALKGQIEKAMAEGDTMLASRIAKFAQEAQIGGTSLGESGIEALGLGQTQRGVKLRFGQELGLEELLGQDIDTTAVNAVNEMKTAFETAFIEGDLAEAFDLATTFEEKFGDPALMASLQAGVEAMGVPFDEFKTDTETVMQGAADATTRVTDAMGRVRVKVGEDTTATAKEFQEFADVTLDPLESIRLALAGINTEVDILSDTNLIETANAAASAATQGGPTPGSEPEFQHGGAFSGIGKVHADEIIMASPRGQQIAALNRATSSELMSGLSQILGGLGVNTTNNQSSVVNNVTINAASRAEDVAGMNGLSSALRGF